MTAAPYKTKLAVGLLTTCLGASPGGCTAGVSEKQEARTLFEAISQLDLSRPGEFRAQQVGLLKRMRLHHAPLAQVRDRCVEVHERLLDAEHTQLEAKQRLRQAAANAPDGRVDPKDGQRILDAIERSNRALSEAQTAFPDCERLTRELATKAR